MKPLPTTRDIATLPSSELSQCRLGLEEERLRGLQRRNRVRPSKAERKAEAQRINAVNVALAKVDDRIEDEKKLAKDPTLPERRKAAMDRLLGFPAEELEARRAASLASKA
jgi:hypothetical protein